MDSKTRSKLKALASREEAIFQLGKNEVGENLLKKIDEALTARELVKITVLETHEGEDSAAVICKKLGCEQVVRIGNKLVLYRVSTKPGVKHVLE